MMFQMYAHLEEDLNKFDSSNNAIATQVNELEALGAQKGPEFDYFWTNDEDQIVKRKTNRRGAHPLLEGEGKDGAFCVEKGKVMSIQVQCSIDLMGNDSNFGRQVTFKLYKNGNKKLNKGKKMAQSRFSLQGKQQSISLFFKEYVEDDAEYQVFVVNDAKKSVMISANECQVGFQVYDKLSYPLAEVLPTCD